MAETKYKFEAIGTSWQIDIADELTKERQGQILNRIRSRIESFDKDYSRFRADSLVTRMSKEVGTYELPEDAKQMLDVYEKLYKLTGGALTPLIGKVMEDAGYDPQYSLEKRSTLTQPPSWNEAIEYSFPTLTVKKPVMLDFGSAGKGYLIDIVVNILRDEGLTNFTVDAGGDIVRQSANNDLIRVGLENPSDTTTAIGVVTFGSGSLCGSAGTRRTWGEFHHIIDPYTLKSPRHILATWVVADTALIGDAIATALFFTSAKALEVEYNFKYLILNADHSILKSDDFPAELFTSENK